MVYELAQTFIAKRHKISQSAVSIIVKQSRKDKDYEEKMLKKKEEEEDAKEILGELVYVHQLEKKAIVSVNQLVKHHRMMTGKNLVNY